MAKMKIYEIARSIQQQDKNIKSGDLVTLLNENGFEVKGANSNIEDEAIGFLMNYFKKKKAAAKAEPKEEVKAPVKEEPKVEKKCQSPGRWWARQTPAGLFRRSC